MPVRQGRKTGEASVLRVSIASASAAKVAAVAFGALSVIVGAFSLAPAILAITAGVLAFKGLDEAGVISLKNVRKTAEETWTYFTDVFGPMFGTIKDAAVESWGAILTAIQAGDFQNAGEIAMAGLEVAMAAGALAMTTLWQDFVHGLAEMFAGIPIMLIESLEDLASGPLGALLGPAVKIAISAGVTESMREGLGRRVTASGQVRDEAIGDSRQTLADAQARLGSLTAAERAREAARNRPEEFVEEIGPEEFVEDIPLLEQVAAGNMPPELRQGMDMWRDWLGTAAQAVRDVAQTDIPIIGMNLGEAAIAAGVPEQAMTAAAGANWNQQFRETGAATGAATGISLGPTFSAAAAQAAGQMGMSSPEARMEKSIYEMAQELKEMGLMTREQTVTNAQVATMYERFLAAFTYG